jgi:hypothetical protein
MKRAVPAVAAIVASLVLAAPANAATPTERRLQKQVNVLKKDVKALKTQTRNLTSAVNALAALVVCTDAATADALQGTWAKIEQHEGTGTSLFGPQQPISDLDACRDLQITRASSQPTVSVLQAIVNFFR